MAENESEREEEAARTKGQAAAALLSPRIQICKDFRENGELLIWRTPYMENSLWYTNDLAHQLPYEKETRRGWEPGL